MAEEASKERLTKEELKMLVQILNQPRQMDLQTSAVLIELSNKISRMIGGVDKKAITC